MWNWLPIFLATGFGLGSATFLFFQRLKIFFPSLPSGWTGAGLVGSLFSLLLVWLGGSFQGWLGFVILFLFTFLAIFICGQTEKIFKVKDDPRIILDEIIGFLWASAFLPLTLSLKEKAGLLLLAFLLFRIFDVAKLPFPQVQRLPGGVGIVADDLCAGLLTNLLLQITLRF